MKNFLVKKNLNLNGLVSSLIDYSDHYSHTDNKINSLNFLKFDDLIGKSITMNTYIKIGLDTKIIENYLMILIIKLKKNIKVIL